MRVTATVDNNGGNNRGHGQTFVMTIKNERSKENADGGVVYVVTTTMTTTTVITTSIKVNRIKF